MYTCGFDKEKAMLVVVWSGTSNSSEDYQRLVADMSELDRCAAAQGRPAITIVEVEPGNPRPSSLERQQLIDPVNSQTLASRHYFALVTTSTLARGVLTAVGWFVSASARRQNSCHADFEKALAWLEPRLPCVGSRVRELRLEARREGWRSARPPANGSARA